MITAKVIRYMECQYRYILAVMSLYILEWLPQSYNVLLLCILQWSPRIQPGNQLYVHHMIMYHCSSLNETTDLGPGSDCAEGAFRNCGSTSILAAWAVGGEVSVVHMEGMWLLVHLLEVFEAYWRNAQSLREQCIVLTSGNIVCI